ncbi:hypothetical protein HJC23_011759 [Cyclotella cryptica]|uniref:SAM-dependent MTase RsmB/NOP-type domain-containing protein n=1 Tax=Cyclotella cryptica TaxID=29204 RepID=A0ABD3PG23_9STRA
MVPGVVHLNGKCCKVGRTVLNPGDLVSMKLEPTGLLTESSVDEQRELIAWYGSAAVAIKLEEEGKNISERKRDVGKRKGRMMPALDQTEVDFNKRSKSNEHNVSVHPEVRTLPPFLLYYRQKLRMLWKPDIHEAAMSKALPLTIRVLKPTDRLEKELRSFGFRKVMARDLSLELCDRNDSTIRTMLDAAAAHELFTNAWIMEDEMRYQNDIVNRRELGVFLSYARISGEILQQELNSMLPVSILAAFLKKQNVWHKQSNLRFLDLCAAPGSKTCQLLTTLNNLLETSDFTVVANELMSHRASRTRSRCCFQGNKTLSHLIVTAGDGRQYTNMGKHYFDFVLCDVPCSGDGTIRKSPEKLGKWTTKSAEKNKQLQKELLKVGLDLLKPTNVSDDDDAKGGGVLLYSTCSLNPVENDDVILEVLKEMNESSQYSYEILSLADISTSRNESRQQKGNFLRVLPAASHGGFFVAALAKTLINSDMDEDLNDNPIRREDKDDLIWAYNNITTKETVAFAISPCTRQCCIDLSKLRDIQLVGCGVPFLYKSDKSVEYILQEGCSCLDSEKMNDVVPSFSVTQAELKTYFKGDLGHSIVPFSSMHEASNDIQSDISCIVQLSSYNSTGKHTKLLLPGKILRADRSRDQVTVEITARPQILKRAFANIDMKR